MFRGYPDPYGHRLIPRAHEPTRRPTHGLAPESTRRPVKSWIPHMRSVRPLAFFATSGLIFVICKQYTKLHFSKLASPSSFTFSSIAFTGHLTSFPATTIHGRYFILKHFSSGFCHQQHQKLHPLILDQEDGNYVSWVELFHIHTCAYDVLDHIDATVPRPPSVDDPTWNRIDAIVKQWIYVTISKDLLQTIMKPGASAQELWTSLEQLFQDNKHTRVSFGGGLRISQPPPQSAIYPSALPYNSRQSREGPSYSSGNFYGTARMAPRSISSADFYETERTAPSVSSGDFYKTETVSPVGVSLIGRKFKRLNPMAYYTEKKDEN
ncbi:hypothetical protein OSB04_012298 [Centaurea solstitialis]|uniref:Uncharacterized protein n=1 Tax=Centaurea solstitialis TaxID=347529 RepID=A0AA38TB40_9ASTR|nr:hypothetical protein OSB04_012298 [Centaurea solstitialis]